MDKALSGVRLYFTMLNHNKRSITLNAKTAKAKQVLETLIRHCDVLVENFAPGAMERMGLSWQRIHELNPRMIVGSVKGFGPGRYEDCKVYENVAQCAGGAASTTGFDDGPPVVTGAQIGDSGTGLHLALGIVTALYQRTQTGRGQPGSILKCKDWETDPNAYIYFITQAAVWPAVCKMIGEESWIEDEAYATPAARLLHLKPIFARIEPAT